MTAPPPPVLPDKTVADLEETKRKLEAHAAHMAQSHDRWFTSAAYIENKLRLRNINDALRRHYGSV